MFSLFKDLHAKYGLDDFTRTLLFSLCHYILPLLVHENDAYCLGSLEAESWNEHLVLLVRIFHFSFTYILFHLFHISCTVKLCFTQMTFPGKQAGVYIFMQNLIYAVFKNLYHLLVIFCGIGALDTSLSLIFTAVLQSKGLFVHFADNIRLGTIK